DELSFNMEHATSLNETIIMDVIRSIKIRKLIIPVKKIEMICNSSFISEAARLVKTIEINPNITVDPKNRKRFDNEKKSWDETINVLNR
ncbi:hypothetical protein PMAYCL1PPCAC_05902, partial [Pristionchus mayeri]